MKSLVLTLLLIACAASAQDGRISGIVQEPNGGRVLPSTELTIISDDAGGRVHSARTGAGGRFLFEGLPYGAYTLTARKAGYEAGNPVTRAATISDADPAAKVAVELRKSIVLAGTVTDPDGDPLAEVAVELYRWQTLRGRRRLVTSGGATTNDLGEFRVHGLGPERYLLRVNPLTLLGVRGVLAYEFQPAYFPGVTDAAGAATLAVNWGAEVAGLDMQVQYAQRTAVEGQVFLPDGTVCESCLVSAIGSSKELTASVTTRPNGSFAVRGLSAGDYELVALPRRGAGGHAVVPIRLNEDEPLAVAMTLGPSRQVSGRARFGPDAESSEIAKFGIRLDAASGALFTRGRPTQANSQGDGSFLIKRVVPGEYDLSVSGLKEGAYLDRIRVGGQPLEGFTIRVSSDYDLSDVDLILADDGGQVSGVVDGKRFAAANEAAPPGIVALIPIPYGHRGRFEMLASYRQQDGQFAFRAVPPGDYTLVTVPRGNHIDLGEPADLELLRRGGQRVEVRPRQSTETSAPFLPNPD